jgi:hypothetical protein
MTKKQVAVLILGCLLIIAGFVTVIGMAKDNNTLYRIPSSLQPEEETLKAGKMSVKESDAHSLPAAGAGAETDRAIMSAAVPPWVYFIVFIVIVLLVRRETINFRVRSAGKSGAK